MEQVKNIKFVREAHIKKFTKLMKYDLPAELENLRWERWCKLKELKACCDTWTSREEKKPRYKCIHITFPKFGVGKIKQNKTSLLC